jgi:hypothetical protein
MILRPEIEVTRKHFSWPQRRSLIVRPKVEVAVIARGGGKTTKIIAPRMAHNAYAMPRSLGGMMTPSYKKLFTELIGGIYDGLDDLGYIEGEHYLIGKKGPDKWGVPHKRLRDWTHAMHWNCGSARAFISQDRPGMGQGLSMDDMIVDEAALIDGFRFENKIRQAIRGNLKHFGGKAEHHSLLIVTDKGDTKKSRWYEKYKAHMDPEVIELIFKAYYEQQQLILALRENNLAESTRTRYLQEINTLEADLNYLRGIATYYHEGNVLDSIEVYGWDKLLEDEKNMDPVMFRRSLLNEDVSTVEGAWYSHLDDSVHCYIPSITAWTTERGYDRDRLTARDCRHDAEILPDLPLEIACDYGGHFNCMAVGQLFQDLLRIDNGLHANHPSTTGDMVRQFVKYYASHPTKLVYYYYDDTAKDTHGTTPYTYFDVVLKVLTDAGWTVRPIYIGPTPDPPVRYEMFVAHLRQVPPPVMWNPDNCHDMMQSMRNVRIEQGPKGRIRKNKSGEKKGRIEDQVHEPHYSDAVDTLVYGALHVGRTPDRIGAASIHVR